MSSHAGFRGARVARVVAIICGAAFGAAFAQDHGPPVQVTPAARHDHLASLRAVVPQADGYAHWHAREEHTIPLPPVPPGQRDGAVQATAALAPLAPAALAAFEGVGNGFSGPDGTFSVLYAPPDTVGAIGATQYVQVVNTGLAVFDKASGSVVYGPVPTNTLWQGFGGACEIDNDGDGLVVYDHLANRWIVSQFAVGKSPYLECVAVSQTSDATGAWNRYAFSYGTVFPDYPKMGVWPDAYYTTFNMFRNNSFLGSQVCAYDRAAMLAGSAATQQCVQLASSFGGVLPADLDGATLPPAAAPNYLLNFGANSLNLWRFHVDWNNPANSTLGAPVNLPVAAFKAACNGGSCIPQAGTSQKLDSLADRLMFRLAYRNFGSHETLVVNHSVQVGTGSNPYSGVRWYEIRDPAGTPTVYQQSTFAPDTSYRWMGSAAMDGDGNLMLGYSVSSATLMPAVRFAGRLAGDPPNTLQAEASVIEGAGAQTGPNLDRWGDYGALTIDPVDDCTFWFTSEYQAANGSYNWHTRIASFKFDGCTTRQAQVITFPNPGPLTFAPEATFAPGASASSGLTVSYASGTPAVCSVAGTLATIHAAGTCTITASQAGDANWHTATPVTQHVAIAPADQTIGFTTTAPAPAAAGGTYTPAATATSGLAVMFSIDAASSANACAFDGTDVTFAGVGTCIVDADQPGDGNYNAAARQQQAISVVPGPPALLVFTTPPADVVAGSALGTVAATLEDAYANIIDDSAGSVDFALAACTGQLALGSAPMSHGVATLNVPLRLYTAPATLQVGAATAALTGLSPAFQVLANTDLVAGDGFESCRP